MTPNKTIKKALKILAKEAKKVSKEKSMLFKSKPAVIRAGGFVD